jgi:hypothetical protein
VWEQHFQRLLEHHVDIALDDGTGCLEFVRDVLVAPRTRRFDQGKQGVESLVLNVQIIAQEEGQRPAHRFSLDHKVVLWQFVSLEFEQVEVCHVIEQIEANGHVELRKGMRLLDPDEPQSMVGWREALSTEEAMAEALGCELDRARMLQRGKGRWTPEEQGKLIALISVRQR